MELSLFVLGMLAGWCGTPWPIRFPWWRWPPPPPTPEPVCPLCGNIFATLGGLAGTAVLASLWPNEVHVSSVILVGALGGRIAGAVYAGFAPMREEN